MKKFRNAYVICKPSWIPPSNTAQGIYKFILLPPKLYREFSSEKWAVRLEALLEHEYTHIQRQKTYGIIKWILRYSFDKNYRYKEELASIVAEMHVYKSRNEIFNFDKSAKFLSSRLYLNCVTYKKARRDLKEFVDHLR